MGRRRFSSPARVPLKSAQDIEYMRQAGRVVGFALQRVGEAIRAGITTGELDKIAEQTIRGMGAVPAFLNYNGYPATACLSVNEEVVHGIPGGRVLHEGDIIGVDLGAIVDGWHGDAAYTFAVGPVSEETQRLLAAGEAALAAGISAAKVGNRLRDIGDAIQRTAEASGYSVVRDLCGHGIGRKLHEEPQVPNYRGSIGEDRELVAGMTLAIEPMVNTGTFEVKLLADGWTFVTLDRKLSVHFEHTVYVRPEGPEILTRIR